MKHIRTLIRKIFFGIINFLIKAKPFMALFNFFFERSSYNIVVYLTRHVIIPNKNFNWTIRLYNKNKVVTRVQKDNPKTWHIALSYKWHDRAQNMMETILADYYPENTMWIDCGANLGLRSLTALSKKMKVYMIEPNKETNILNLERCKLNNFSNYEILPFGASNTDAEMTFYIDKSSYLSSLNKENVSDENINSTETIQVRKIDTLFSEQIHTLSRAFIKIDVEGHEKEVLEGAEEFIKTIFPTLFIEINEKGEHIEAIFTNMRNRGYVVYETTQLVKNSKFLWRCPDNVSNYKFKSNDFLFVKDKNLIIIFDTFAFSAAN